MTVDDTISFALADLSPAERSFVLTYVNDPELRIDRAAERAGMAGQGADLVKLPTIRQAISRLLAGKNARLDEIRECTVYALYQLAFGWDPKNMMRQGHDKDKLALPTELPPHLTKNQRGLIMDAVHAELPPKFLPPDQLPPECRAAIKGMKYKDGQWEYTLVDRHVVLMSLLKHYGDMDKVNENNPLDKTDEKTTIVMIKPE